MGWAGHADIRTIGSSSYPSPARRHGTMNPGLNIYRQMEDCQGASDATRRRTGGLVFVQSPPDPNPIAPAMVEGARSIGMPIFDSNNGRMMEGAGGASIIDVRVGDGNRQSVFR